MKPRPGLPLGRGRVALAFALGALPAALPRPTGAQTSRADPSDLQGWYTLDLEVRLPRDFTADLKYRLRTENDGSHYRGSYFYAELERELGALTVLSVYRLGLAHGSTMHRLAAGLEGAVEWGDLELSLRPIVQVQRELDPDDADGGESTTLLRTRLRAKYDVTRALTVYGCIEPFVGLDQGWPLDNIRNTIGLSYAYAKRRKVGVFYIYRPDYAKSYDRLYHVVGVELELNVRPFAGR